MPATLVAIVRPVAPLPTVSAPTGRLATSAPENVIVTVVGSAAGNNRIFPYLGPNNAAGTFNGASTFSGNPLGLRLIVTDGILAATGGALTEPFGRFRNFFNVYRVDVVSNQAGADDPLNNITVDTALGATYMYDGVTDRLLSVDFTLANNVMTSALSGTTLRPDMRFVTVNADDADVSRCIDAGGDDLLVQPYSLDITPEREAALRNHVAQSYGAGAQLALLPVLHQHRLSALRLGLIELVVLAVVAVQQQSTHHVEQPLLSSLYYAACIKH